MDGAVRSAPVIENRWGAQYSAQDYRVKEPCYNCVVLSCCSQRKKALLGIQRSCSSAGTPPDPGGMISGGRGISGGDVRGGGARGNALEVIYM